MKISESMHAKEAQRIARQFINNQSGLPLAWRLIREAAEHGKFEVIVPRVSMDDVSTLWDYGYHTDEVEGDHDATLIYWDNRNES